MHSNELGGSSRDRITEDVVDLLAMGFDHVRIPVFERTFWTEDMRRIPETVSVFEHGVRVCAERGLRMVVNMHILRSHFFNDENEPALFRDEREVDRFVLLWKDLASMLVGYDDDLVAYEILNEPVCRDPDGAGWNRVARRMLASLRDREPDRTIVLGSNWYSNHEMYEFLEIPDDPHLWLTFHYYRPLLVTHHAAPWCDHGSYEGPVHYPGQSVPDELWKTLNAKVRESNDKFNIHYDRDVMKRDLSLPVRRAREAGKPIYCSEFGCIEHTPDDVRRRWYADFLSVLEEYGIPWSHWDYRGDTFGILRDDGSRAVMADLLTGARVASPR
jgi:endoglucanase